MSEERLIEKGEWLLLTYGEHDDFRVVGIGRALEPIDIDGALKVYLDNRPEQHRYFDPDWYMDWLEDRGLIEFPAHREWHLGEHGGSDMRITAERE